MQYFSENGSKIGHGEEYYHNIVPPTTKPNLDGERSLPATGRQFKESDDRTRTSTGKYSAQADLEDRSRKFTYELGCPNEARRR